MSAIKNTFHDQIAEGQRKPAYNHKRGWNYNKQIGQYKTRQELLDILGKEVLMARA